MFQSQPGQMVCKTIFQKYPTQEMAGQVAQVGVWLPSKHETLNSNPSTTKIKVLL
jgi:hypothetical protein